MAEHGFHCGYERLAAALRGAADRVPFVAQMHELAMAWTGAAAPAFYSRPELLAGGIIRTAEELGFDVPCFGYDVYNIELEALGQQLAFVGGGAPTPREGRPLVGDRADLARLRPPRPGEDGRMPFVLEARRLFQERAGVAPAIQFCAPFSLATLVRGYAAFIEDVALEPGFAHELLGFLTERVIAPWIDAQLRALPGGAARAAAGPPAAVGADALCSPPMTSPAIIREFSVPYILRLRELCAARVSVVNWWGESSLRDPAALLELKRQVATDVIRVQDPDVERLGAGPFKDYALRHGLALELGVGEPVIDQGPVAAIRARIRDCILQAGDGGRLILYFASLGTRTPPDHVRAAIQAVKDFGGRR